MSSMSTLYKVDSIHIEHSIGGPSIRMTKATSVVLGGMLLDPGPQKMGTPVTPMLKLAVFPDVYHFFAKQIPKTPKTHKMKWKSTLKTTDRCGCKQKFSRAFGSSYFTTILIMLAVCTVGKGQIKLYLSHYFIECRVLS